MIETMYSVTIAALSGEEDRMLHALRAAGIVHIRQMAASCEASQRIAARAKSLMTVMNAVSDEAGKGAKCAQEKLSGTDFESLHESLEKAIAESSAAVSEKLRIQGEISRIESWGDFDPDRVRELASMGCALRFYTVDRKVLDAVKDDDSFTFIRLGQLNGSEAVATVNSAMPASVSAREFILPDRSLTELRREAGRLDGVISASSGKLAGAAKYLDAYALRLRQLDQEARYECVRATSRREAGLITLLSGYVPECRVEDFRTLARTQHWAYMIDSISEDDNPPTRLKYRGLVRIMQPIYDILGTVPGYREYDISLWFLIFFSIFFAMIIGDAGYGLIFLIIAIVMNIRSRKCSDINILLYVLSATTIVYGAVTGTWFGSLTILQKFPFLQSFIIPSICNYSMELYGIESVFAQNNVMELCFILGASQLGLACVLNVVHKIPKRDLSLLGDIGWLIDVIVLYMMALYLVIGASVDFTIVIAGVAAGFLLVVIFGSQEPGKSFASGLKSGLGGFFTSFLDTVSCFSNIMSYIRLFAVGMASLAIAQSFNNMAGMAGPVFGAVIAVLGTALNLVMGLLSVVVHGVRLNLLEFSGQLSMEWTGYKYEPFRETVETANETEQGVVK